jgi:hypothetical protein
MSTDQTTHMASFIRYAMAFETAYASDDWKVVDDLLANDISWVVEGVAPPIGGVFFQRAQVIEAMRSSCNMFDRRFNVRIPATTETPIEIPGWCVLPFHRDLSTSRTSRCSTQRTRMGLFRRRKTRDAS